ncbi:DUF927 domain-containing protein [Mameliella sp. AT18]|nr:DUF927 domain-containing protein [Mameliella sp. AT18]ODM46048.1 hypothetical protein A9320_08530 [Ruegeria sp. PBVC088]
MTSIPDFSSDDNLPVAAGLSDVPDLPSGYVSRSDGIWVVSDEDNKVRICGPIAAVALGHTDAGDGWCKCVVFQDRNRELHDLIFPLSMFNDADGKAVLKQLLDRGFWIAGKAGKAVLRLLDEWEPEQRITLFNRHGWLGGDFRSYAMGNGSVLGAYGRTSTAHIDFAVGQSGTLVGWREEVARLCAGNPLAILAVCQALAGPLLRPLGAEGGGFHFHGASSCGKTTLLKLACSVWGDADYRRGWHSTCNAFEPVACMRNDSFLPLDEIGEADAKSAGETAYMLANGLPKTRMTAEGKEKAQARWKIAVLSNGEIPFAQFLGEARKNSKKGMLVRLVDVRVDGRQHGAFDDLHGMPDGGTFVNVLQDGCNACHGHAGPAFVRWLIEMSGWERVKSTFTELRRFYYGELGSARSAQTERVADRFALAALAGELATRAELTGWNKGESLNACREVLVAWRAVQQETVTQPIDEIIKHLRPCIEDPKGCELNETGTTLSAPRGWYDDQFLYLRPETLKSICGDEAKRVAGRLHDAGMLERCKEGLQYKLPRSIDPDRSRAYVIARRATSPRE